MSILGNILNGVSNGATVTTTTGTSGLTSPAAPLVTLTLLPGLAPVATASVGGLAGVQVGSGAAAAAPTTNIDLLLGLTPAPASTGSGGVGVGVGVGVTGSGTGTGAGTGTGTGSGTGTGTGTGSTGGGGTGGGGTTVGVTVGSAPLPDAHAAYENIFRTPAADVPSDVSAQLDTLNQMVASGQITAKQAILQIVHAAAGSTAVAETSYAFFSGLTPTADGLTYLVHSSANPGDLSDSYYASFNTENRYINFAANLGLHSDYAPAFAAIFGPESFDGAVRSAYDRIVGNAQAQAAGINPELAINNIEAQLPYFQQIAHERFAGDNFDLSTKLAAIAYILEEAVKANVGSYGVADQNFLYDLADGKAQFHVDLVATYGKGTPLDVV